VSGIPFLQLLFKLPSALFSLTDYNFQDYHPDLFVIPFVAAIAILIVSKSKKFDWVPWLLTSILGAYAYFSVSFLVFFFVLMTFGAYDVSFYVSGVLSMFVSMQYSIDKAEKHKVLAALIFPILVVVFMTIPTSPIPNFAAHIVELQMFYIWWAISVVCATVIVLLKVFLSTRFGVEPDDETDYKYEE